MLTSPGTPEHVEQARDGALLLAVVQELSHLRDLDGVMAVVRRAARELTGADGVTFVLRDGDHVFYAEENAIAPLWKGRRFPMSCCISGWVMAHKVHAVIEDVFTDPRIPQELYRATFVKSLAVIPIRQADPIGAIGAYWSTRHLASPRELGLLQALAGATSIAMANAELYREARAAQAAAEAASRAKDVFLTLVSHELRTPLTSILGWTRILRERPRAPEVTARGLEVIDRNAKVQAQIVEDLLGAARIFAEGIALAPHGVEVCQLVSRVASEMRAAALEKGVELSCSRAEEPLVVAGDPERLAEVVARLVSNALKFTPAGGSVDVACRREGARATISIRDTGSGIAPDELTRLFEAFRQGDESPTRAHGGLGLGLFVVRHLVDKHGGEITVESAGAGQGTIVTLRFVLAPP